MTKQSKHDNKHKMTAGRFLERPPAEFQQGRAGRGRVAIRAKCPETRMHVELAAGPLLHVAGTGALDKKVMFRIRSMTTAREFAFRDIVFPDPESAVKFVSDSTWFLDESPVGRAVFGDAPAFVECPYDLGAAYGAAEVEAPPPASAA